MPTIDTSGALGGDLLLASGASAYLQAILTYNPDQLRVHPALMNLSRPGQFVGTQGSSNFTLMDLDGTTRLTSMAEGAQLATETISSALSAITVANFGGPVALTDEMRGRDPLGGLNYAALAMRGFGRAMKTLAYNIGQLAGSGSRSVGSTGTPFSHDIFMQATGQAELGTVPGPYLMILGNKQFVDWRTDLESRGGSTQWRPATVEMQALRGGSCFKGSFDGVDIFAFPDMKNDLTDYTGMLFGRGGIGFAEETIAPSPMAHVIANAGAFVVEGERTAAGRFDTIHPSYRHGVVVVEAARVINITSRYAA